MSSSAPTKSSARLLSSNPTPLTVALALAFPLVLGAAAPSAQAQNFWTGANGNDFSQAGNWQGPLSTYDWVSNSSLATDPNIINAPGDGRLAPVWDNSNTVQLDSYLGIGSGAGAQGELAMKVDLSRAELRSYMVDFGQTPYGLVVGEKQGRGTLAITVDGNMLGGIAHELYFGLSTSNVAVGLEGSGTVDLVGQGKQGGFGREAIWPLDPFIVPRMAPQLAVGVGATGQGTVNIQQARMSFSRTPYHGGEQLWPVEPAVLVGDQGGQGDIHVMGGGKLSGGNAEYYEYKEDNPQLPSDRVAIGRGAGSSGTVSVDASSLLSFSLGTQVGVQGGSGAIELMGVGKFDMGRYQRSFTSACTLPLEARHALSVGVTGKGRVAINGASGAAHILGQGSQNEYYYDPNDPYATSSLIQGVVLKRQDFGRMLVGSQGVLTVADQGVLGLGAAIAAQVLEYDQQGNPSDRVQKNLFFDGYGQADVQGGTIVLGQEGVATAAGSVLAASVNLKDAASKLVFNHTDKVTFAVPLQGAGRIVQMAGTTTIDNLGWVPDLSQAVLDQNGSLPQGSTWSQLWAFDPVCGLPELPGDQSAFAGTVAVEGGTLQLPIPNLMPAASAYEINAGAKLVMGSTQEQALGNVNLLAGGVIDMSGVAQASSKNASQEGSTTRATNPVPLPSVAVAGDLLKAKDWAGGGTVQLDTELGDDTSPSDLIEVAGDISGTTTLKINNLNGQGGNTANGILVVKAAKANAPQSFVLDGGRVVAGTTSYVLQQKGFNWYLLKSDPVLTTSDSVISQGEAVTVDVVANDATQSGSAVQLDTSFALEPDPSSAGTAAYADGKIVFTPAAGFVGQVRISYQARSANGETAIGELLVDVQKAPVTDNPVSTQPDQETSQGGTVTIDVLANDTTADGTPPQLDTTFALILSDPASGTVGYANGQIEFTPNAGYSGTVEITYQARSAQGQVALGTVTVTVDRQGGGGTGSGEPKPVPVDAGWMLGLLGAALAWLGRKRLPSR